MYSKKYTKADVKNVPNVLISISHLLNANHVKLCAVESKMNKDENQAHRFSRQNILTVVRLQAQIKISSTVSYIAFFSPV